ncbi:FMN-binding protein [Streptomyces azureus]|uniref:FMN-binding protein n=1 Tax=Streptomyces azureus TaxID=146537 RepID=A0A0K8PSS0_STRAJ|nr:FMN-binding protein [Streptomyces azureus]
MPVVSVPGSAAAGEVDQVPTQVPVEAGAAELFGRRLSVMAFRLCVPSSDATPTYMAMERATMAATSPARRA